MMNAIVLNRFGGTENFSCQQVDKPVNTEDNVLVKIKATAFNPIDCQMRRGATESKLLKSSILGRELSGIIEEVGSHVKQLKIGDEVVAYVGSLGSNGTYTEYIHIPGELVALKPQTISFEEAAALPMVGLTALQCFERLPLTKNETVFIAGGAGGVGTMFIKLCLAHGIDHLVTTAGNTESWEQVLKLGVKAENILDYKDPTLVEHLFQKNNQHPFTCCIDLVGGHLSEVCSEIFAVNGYYADVTYLATDKAREVLFDKGATIVNISNYAYSLSGKLSDLVHYGKKLTYLMQLLANGTLTPPPIQIVGDLSLQTVIEAHRMLDANLTKGKKLVMTIA
jgi:NADPH:quinone reductase-like Zn-dependent oxidoreductase